MGSDEVALYEFEVIETYPYQAIIDTICQLLLHLQLPAHWLILISSLLPCMSYII